LKVLYSKPLDYQISVHVGFRKSQKSFRGSSMLGSDARFSSPRIPTHVGVGKHKALNSTPLILRFEKYYNQ
jgi:hypothetical protein